MYDYQIVCFNGANRTKDQETTDAMAVHPISARCEEFVENFCRENGIVCLGGVALVKGLLSKLTIALEQNGFMEEWTCFSDEFAQNICVQ